MISSSHFLRIIFSGLILTFGAVTACFAQCDTSRWVATVDGGVGNPVVDTLGAQNIFVSGVLQAPPQSFYPTPYYVNFHFKDTICITNNFSFEVRLKNDPADGGAVSGDTWMGITGSGITAGCLLEGTPAGQIYTGIFVGSSWAGNIPELVMNLSTWRTIRFDFIDNVVYYSYDGSNFFSLPYSGSICNITGLNFGFREAGEVDWVKIYDGYGAVVYYEEFNDCNNLAAVPDCLPPLVTASSSNPAYCENDSILLTGSSNVSVQYSWVGPNGFNSTEQNPALVNASLSQEGWYILTGFVNPCTPANSDSVYVKVNQKKSTTVNPSICQGEFYTAGGANQTTAGIYYDTLSTVNGCDSVLITQLTVLSVSATSLSVSICQDDSFFVGGAYQQLPGAYNDTLQNIHGCDSVVTTNLSLILPVYYNQNFSICLGDSILLGGAYQHFSGTYYDTLTSLATACDSVIISALQVNVPAYTYFTTAICQGDSILLGGAYQSSAGVYHDSLLSAVGCDSIIITTLQLNPVTYGSQVIAICQGDSFFAGGTYQVLAGTYIDTIQNTLGCDSILNTTLQLILPVYQNLSVSVCDGDSFFVGGSYQSLPGTYYDTLQSSQGCDSILITALQLIPPVTTTLNVSICLGDSIYAGGSYQTTPGTYADKLQSIAGCDSIVTTILQVIYPLFQTNTVFICDGQSYFAGGNWQTMTGSYADTLAAVTGCDSIVTTDLTVYPNPMVYLGADTSLCKGSAITFDAGNGFSTYVWNDQSNNQTLEATGVGTYSVTVADQNGCTTSDTIEITDAWDVPAGFLPEDSAVCGKFSRFIIIPGYEEYQWNFGSTDSSVEFTTAGEYIVIVKDFHGCEGSDTIIFESLCEEALIMPNAFTPNGDGLNDIFKPVLLDDLTDFEFKVYNRWGKVIFFSANPDDGWDGNELEIAKGIEQYVWTVRYRNSSGEERAVKGSVTLLR